MDAGSLRRSFIDFFTARGHTYRPSASLIPIDPTLLLTNAGMVPFKPYFLGEESPPYRRAVSVQKVARTVDIDIIGTTQRHLSFFEMLGNFSFGDYFKKEAIGWAHEFVTEHLGLDPDRLWFTVYETDEEARAIWVERVGVAEERVQFGGKDNFWQMGVPGPCGPSSEIFYDKGAGYGAEGGPIGGGEERYVEIWNLVFMQNIQDEPYHVVGDLPARSIDTGMGLERAAAVMQGVDTVFETDAIRPTLDSAAAATGVAYGAAALSDVSLRILADHGRTMTMLIADGVVPSNEGRGYVLRRILRRAVRHAWQLGGTGLITPVLAESVVANLGDAYPELISKYDLIRSIVEREESRFRRTLESGHQLLDTELAGKTSLPGGVAFKLHDTFGFPIELTTEIATERGVEVDRAGFEAEMEAQRARARKAWRGGDAAAAAQLYGRVLDDTGPTRFTGYEVEADTGQVLAIMRDGELVERADRGQDIEVFLDLTPFYAESGGQVGDTGSITTETGALAVNDTRHALQGLHGHRARVISGHVQVGQSADLVIDSPRRERIRKSHTGTHVLHWALREVLGSHTHQAGSLVESGRLRFDFSHFAAVAPTELAEIESLTNRRLIENGKVTTTLTTKEEAERQGALAFFGDKYGDTVRLVRIGQFSAELCGGTHTHTAAQVGPLLVMGESSIGTNLRRIEALSGETAYQQIREWRSGLTEAGRLLRTAPTEVPGRIEGLLARIEEMEGHLDAYRQRERAAAAAELAGRAEAIGPGRLVVASWPDLNPEQLRLLTLATRDRLGPGVVVLGSAAAGKASLVGTVTKDLQARGLSAAEIVAEGARLLGGGGSRDPELSQAGGPRAEQLTAALEVVHEAAAGRMALLDG
ncbi:MAG TPA: alanine--tRNA ligase [Acidimicrobiia bacterium]|nr:alanine--tRNA ligase [Acidimicrobiia bacterium]